MSAISPAAAHHLNQAVGLLNAGRLPEAAQLLTALVAADPGLSPAHRLLGEVRGVLGDLNGAEASLREAVRLGRRDPHAQTALGELLVRKGRTAEAEKALRAALALDRRFEPAANALAALLLAASRPEEALRVTTPLVQGNKVDAALLQRHGEALRALARPEEAVPFYERAVAAAPGSGVAEHNLASALGDAERHADSEAAVRRAIAKGVDAAETWLVLARAVQAQARYDEADAAFREAIKRRPTYPEAHEELSRLIWMRTADVDAAQAALKATLATHPDAAELVALRARLYETAGDDQTAFEIVAGPARRGDAPLALVGAAAALAIPVDPKEAVVLARRSLAMEPDRFDARMLLCAAQLAAGEAQDAAKLAGELLAGAPLNQLAAAYLATAWRMLGDARYQELYDYQAFVRPYQIDTPDGWGSLPAYLADLKASLERLHGLETHPIGQSLRHGSQTSQSLRKLDDPAIKAFFKAIDGPIRRHMTALGKGRDLLRKRNNGRYSISGIWSVRLKPNGFHVNHVHPQGWLSSACYIDVPKAVDAGGHEGWIKFGEPGSSTIPPLAPEHYVKPEPGLLVLFPSYMWHGTVPFSGEERRMTVAFDVVPG